MGFAFYYIHNDITGATSFATKIFGNDIHLHESVSNIRALQRDVKDEFQNFDCWIMAKNIY